MAAPDFSARRAGKSVRSRWLQRLLKRPPMVVREYFAGEHYRRRICDLAEPAQAKAPGTVMSLRKRLLEWNRISSPLDPLPVALRDAICREFEHEVEQLGLLLGRDLTSWLRPGETLLTMKAPESPPEAVPMLRTANLR
jgi:hypothetical protein